MPEDLEHGFQIFHLDGRRYEQAEWPLVRSITAGEDVVDEEYFHVLADGSRLVIRSSSSPVYGAKGEIVAGVLVMVDITAERPVGDRLPYFDRLLENTDDAIVGTDTDFRVTVWNAGAARLYGYSAEDALGRPARDVASYERDQSRLELESSLLKTDQTRTELRARRKDGTWVDVEMVAVAVRDHSGKVVGYLGVHRDITERKMAEQELETRAGQQAAVATLGMHALGGTDPQAVMDVALAAVTRTLQVQVAAITEILPDCEDMVLRAGVGWTEGLVGHALPPRERRSLFGHTVKIGQPVICDDVQTDDRFEASALLINHRLVSAVTVLVEGRDQCFGTLGAFAKERRSFSVDDVNFMQAVANIVAATFEAARTKSVLHGVRQAERRRIARDLHDGALQGLTQALAKAGQRSPSTDSENPDSLMGLLKGVGQQLRAAIYDLRLDEEDNRPLPERLKALVAIQAALSADNDIDITISNTAPNIAGHRATEVVRIVSEALTNARRHSEATQIRVRVSASKDSFSVDISDNGRGFDPNAGPPAAQSTGLRGIGERANLLGARLEISTKPGHGTVVALDLPLKGHQTEAEEVRILLVEDHAAVREAIAALLEREPDFRIVGQAGSLAQARGMLEGVDLALLDLELPDGFGPDLIDDLRLVSPHADALVLSAALDKASIARAVQRGAAATIDKVAHLDEIVDAVRRLRAGETLLPLDEVIELLRYERRRNEQEHDERRVIELLTPREREVLQGLAEGLDSRAIAERLHITLRTERNHIANILAKLDVHSRLQALVLCLRYGVVQIPKP